MSKLSGFADGEDFNKNCMWIGFIYVMSCILLKIACLTCSECPSWLSSRIMMIWVCSATVYGTKEYNQDVLFDCPIGSFDTKITMKLDHHYLNIIRKDKIQWIKYTCIAAIQATDYGKLIDSKPIIPVGGTSGLDWITKLMSSDSWGGTNYHWINIKVLSGKTANNSTLKDSHTSLRGSQ